MLTPHRPSSARSDPPRAGQCPDWLPTSRAVPVLTPHRPGTARPDPTGRGSESEDQDQSLSQLNPDGFLSGSTLVSPGPTRLAAVEACGL